jgi:acetolactate synthase-1/2/3 large subunit
MHIESHQYLDLVAMFAPVTKWNKQIVRPGITPEVVRRAFKTAQSDKPGQFTSGSCPKISPLCAADGHPLPLDSQEKVYASYRTLNMAAAVISKAKNPLILAGNGAICANASEALTEFATALNIPVANTFMGKG